MPDFESRIPLTAHHSSDSWHFLCASVDLVDGGTAVAFDVIYAGQTCRAFALRYHRLPHAYLNRCTHVPMELDWQPGQIFDITGNWLLCSTHGAHFEPTTGACSGGPCRGGLVKIAVTERDDGIWWQAQSRLEPLTFVQGGFR